MLEYTRKFQVIFHSQKRTLKHPASILKIYHGILTIKQTNELCLFPSLPPFTLSYIILDTSGQQIQCQNTSYSGRKKWINNIFQDLKLMTNLRKCVFFKTNCLLLVFNCRRRVKRKCNNKLQHESKKMSPLQNYQIMIYTVGVSPRIYCLFMGNRWIEEWMN